MTDRVLSVNELNRQIGLATLEKHYPSASSKIEASHEALRDLLKEACEICLGAAVLSDSEYCSKDLCDIAIKIENALKQD